MANINDKSAVLLQNLQDAGLDERAVRICMDYAQNGTFGAMLPILKKYRTQILTEVHKEQEKLYCIDYLIFQLEKKHTEVERR